MSESSAAAAEHARGISGDRSSGSFFESLPQDVRFAIRVLRRSPGYTLVAILTLTLGIGATTAIFTVVDRILLKPFAGPDSSRIVVLMNAFGDQRGFSISIPKFMMWRDQLPMLEDASLYGFPGGLRVNLLGGDQPQQYKGTQVSANTFRLYGIPFAKGRGFTAQEDTPGGPPVAAISNGMWRTQFGSDPNIVGKSIDLDGTDYTVVGVMAPIYTPDLNFGDVVLPLQADPNSSNMGNYLIGVARLKPGVTMAQAIAATQVFAEQFRRKYPAMMADPKESFTLQTALQVVISGVSSALWILLGAVGLVLLIACANIASLMLARATLRRREISIRVALGAGRGRIVRQLLTESVLVSLVGGAIGIWLGFFGVRLIFALNPVRMPRLGEHAEALTLDWRILLFAAGISILAGAIAGIVPALKASRVDLAATINESGARSGAGLRGSKTRSLLVVCEMALAMILLAGAALLIRSFHDSISVNPGFQSHNILTMDMSLSGKRFQTTAAVSEVVREGRRRLESIPGVQDSTASCCMPLEGGIGLPINIEGKPPAKGPYNGGGGWASVSPGYFEVYRIPLLRGRTFTVQDTSASEPVVIINESMAKQFWPKGDALGARITIGKGLGPQFVDLPREIVGIVGDVRDRGINNNPGPNMYVPIDQISDQLTAFLWPLSPLQWMVRTHVAPFSLSQQIQEQLRAASGGVPVGTVRTMDEVVSHSLAYERFSTTLLTIFAAIALLLAAVGIYGVMAYSVQQRTQEIGIRMTLGASPEKVRLMVVKQGMLLAGVGVVIGVAGGLAITRVMRSLLFGVKPWDPLMFAVTAILLAIIALPACYVPARRASRVDPLIALRYE
ncbi:MAG: ABC transporter permease [Acidobacteriota bacterium]|nr:ABC transporter permease [Acidobacteriota bacterium]